MHAPVFILPCQPGLADGFVLRPTAPIGDPNARPILDLPWPTGCAGFFPGSEMREPPWFSGILSAGHAQRPGLITREPRSPKEAGVSYLAQLRCPTSMLALRDALSGAGRTCVGARGVRI